MILASPFSRTVCSAADNIALLFPSPVAAFFMVKSASPGESFWQRVMTRMKVGETRAADVRLCLRRPDVSSSSASEERWTYVTARPTALGGALRALRLTFRDSVLADVERTEVNRDADPWMPDLSIGPRPDRHHGFCAPPIPAVADPVPAPIDTSAAAAAAARAQADANAAATNAAAAAAYAACMASDSAR